MQLIIQLFIISLLILIFYQDYKYRAVSWILFPILTIVFLILNLFNHSVLEIVNNTAVNLFFLLFLFAMITVYFSIKNRRIVNLSNGFIGWGDILFILCLGILFSPLNFIAFYLISLFMIIIGVLFTKWLFKSNSDQIPLAGLQAMMLLILFIINLIHPFTNFSTDEWIINALL